MSESLNEKIVANINRREAERIQQEEEMEKAKMDLSKECILSDFKEALDSCLKKLLNYYNHKIVVYLNDCMPYNFKTNVKELGFEFKFYRKFPLSDSEFDYYILSVPEFTGEKLTPAQLMLYKFEQELAKKRKERKEALITECNRLKQEIEIGNYQYSAKGDKKIFLESQESYNTTFEKDVIYNFFSKYNLLFQKESPQFTLVILEN